jgi:hypothetical protein
MVCGAAGCGRLSVEEYNQTGLNPVQTAFYSDG